MGSRTRTPRSSPRRARPRCRRGSTPFWRSSASEPAQGHARRRDQRRPPRLPFPQRRSDRARSSASRRPLGLDGGRGRHGADPDLGARSAVVVLVVPVPRFLQVAALVVLAIDLSGVTLLVALVAAPQICARFITRLVGRWPSLQRRALTAFDTFVHGLDGIRTPSHVVPLIGWTVLVWLAPAFAAWTVLMALDLQLPLAAPWSVLAFVGLGVSIPSAPGYIGTFHFFAKTALALFGVSDAAGVGYALLFHASQILPVTLIGWLYLLRENMSLGDAARARARV